MFTNTYLFTGNAFLVDLMKSDWKKKFTEKYGAMSVNQIDMEEENAFEKLQSELQSGSFFEEKKLVLVKVAVSNKRLAVSRKPGTGTKRTVKKKSDLSEKIGGILSRKPDETFVVFLGATGEEEWAKEIPAENQKILSAMNGQISGYSASRDLPYSAFFMHLFQNKIDPKALQYALNAYQKKAKKNSEPDLLFLARKLEQIAFLDADFQKTSLLDQIMEIEPEEQVFDFLAHFLSGRTEKSIAILQSVLKNGIHPRQLLKTITGQLEQFILIRALLDQKKNAAAIGKATGESRAWLIEKTVQQVRSFSLPVLESMLLQMIDMNRDLNTGGLNGEDREEFQTFFEKIILRFAARNRFASKTN